MTLNWDRDYIINLEVKLATIPLHIACYICSLDVSAVSQWLQCISTDSLRQATLQLYLCILYLFSMQTLCLETPNCYTTLPFYLNLLVERRWHRNIGWSDRPKLSCNGYDAVHLRKYSNKDFECVYLQSSIIKQIFCSKVSTGITVFLHSSTWVALPLWTSPRVDSL